MTNVRQDNAMDTVMVPSGHYYNPQICQSTGMQKTNGQMQLYESEQKYSPLPSNVYAINADPLRL